MDTGGNDIHAPVKGKLNPMASNVTRRDAKDSVSSSGDGPMIVPQMISRTRYLKEVWQDTEQEIKKLELLLEAYQKAKDASKPLIKWSHPTYASEIRRLRDAFKTASMKTDMFNRKKEYLA